MTEKKPGGRKSGKAKKPKLKKETVKDLSPRKGQEEELKGGSRMGCRYTDQCGT